MATTIVLAILAFNIILLMLFFMVKIHKHTVDKARETYDEDVAGDEEIKEE